MCGQSQRSFAFICGFFSVHLRLSFRSAIQSPDHSNARAQLQLIRSAPVMAIKSRTRSALARACSMSASSTVT